MARGWTIQGLAATPDGRACSLQLVASWGNVRAMDATACNDLIQTILPADLQPKSTQ